MPPGQLCYSTKQEPLPQPIVELQAQPEVQALDYDKLYVAVAHAESGYCKSARSKATKNCVSIMSWTGGKRHLKTYSSIEENKKDFISLWKRVYKRFPDYSLAVKYTGNDSAYRWLANVKYYYNLKN